MDHDQIFRRRDWTRQPQAHAPGYKSSIPRSPRKPLVRIDPSISELTGPAFGHDDIDPADNDLLSNYARYGGAPIGERIILQGRVIDENARPMPGTLVEIWQANAGGRYRHVNDTYLAPVDPNFGGCGRTLTGRDGHYRFHTIRPGPYPWPNHSASWRPAHIHVSVFGTGLAQRLVTQCYFEGDPLIALCPIVQTIPDRDAIDRLVARLDLDSSVPFDSLVYRFDIVLRGHRSTPFETRPEGN